MSKDNQLASNAEEITKDNFDKLSEEKKAALFQLEKLTIENKMDLYALDLEIQMHFNNQLINNQKYR